MPTRFGALSGLRIWRCRHTHSNAYNTLQYDNKTLEHPNNKKLWVHCRLVKFIDGCSHSDRSLWIYLWNLSPIYAEEWTITRHRTGSCTISLAWVGGDKAPSISSCVPPPKTWIYDWYTSFTPLSCFTCYTILYVKAPASVTMKSLVIFISFTSLNALI